jgi:hypothetical protein
LDVSVCVQLTHKADETSDAESSKLAHEVAFATDHTKRLNRLQRSVNDMQWSVMQDAHADLMRLTLSAHDDEVKWLRDQQAEADRVRQLEERYLPFEHPRVRTASRKLANRTSSRVWHGPAESCVLRLRD